MDTGFFRKLFSRPDQRASFDAQYRAGEWAFLADLAELGRYSIVAGYCRRLDAKTILDVGCGQGVLAGVIGHLPFESYLGLDFSSEAIRHAREQQTDRRAAFTVADVTSFVPDGRFDAIVFNECLYYLDQPGKVVGAYAKALTPTGRIIVSIHQTARNDRTWAVVEKALRIEDGVTVTNQEKTSWTVKLFAPVRKPEP